MPKIIEIDFRKYKTDQKIEDAIQKSFPTDPFLAQQFRDTYNEIYDLYKIFTSKNIAFSFSANSDSISENEEALRSAVTKMSDEFRLVIEDLFKQIAILKIENCELKNK